MKVYRFMSNREFYAMNSGMDMVPENPSHEGAKTTSWGFCFLPESVIIHGDGEDTEMSAERCFSFLEGIVSEDVLVEFDAPEGYFRVTEGTYMDPYGSDLVWINELCCDSYSRDVLVPLRYATIYFGEMTWYPYF